MNAREIQQALVDAGYDIGPTGVDGKIGPKTKAAMAKYEQDKGHPVDQGGIAAAPTIPDQYAQFAWMYADPELGAGLRMAADQGWSDATLEGWLQKTAWWKTHGQASRNYLQLAATDPAELTQRLYNYDSAQKYIAKAAAYGLTYSLDAALSQVNRVTRGEMGADALDQELKNYAKAAFPYLANQIDAGTTLNDVFEPIKNSAAQILDLNPTTISLTDPKWLSLLQTTDSNGTRRLPTQDEVNVALRTDQRFGFQQSQAGRNFDNDAAQVIGKAFGHVA